MDGKKFQSGLNNCQDYLCILISYLKHKDMSILKFSDGEEFDTSGELRLEHRSDGWYLMGNGMLIPVKDIDEGRELLKKYKGN